MLEVNVTQLRSKLPTYLDAVEAGKEIAVIRRGKVIARIVPSENERKAARRRLLALRKTAWIGDVITPIPLKWSGDVDNL